MVVSSLLSNPVGLLGALPPRPNGWSKEGGRRTGKSLVEMAPEIPRRCPRLFGAREDGFSVLFSDLVGLVLITAIELPSRIRPPTNSLPPRRCPCPAGRLGDGRPFGVLGDTEGFSKKGDWISCGSEAPGLKLKVGNAARPDTSVLSIDSPNECVGDSMADIGRLLELLAKVDGTDEGEGGWAGKTK